MKQTVELSLNQSLSLTHEMRLAIDMLSMSTTEVDELIDEELEKNALLEDAGTDFFGVSRTHNPDAVAAFDVALNTVCDEGDFRAELVRQVGEGAFNQIEREIAYRIIHNLDDDGLFTNHDEAYAAICDEMGVFSEWLDSVRRRIMDFEPLGCGAFDVQEALMHQAKHRCQSPHQEFFKLLEEIKRNPEQRLPFAKLSRMKDDKALDELRALCSRPSSSYGDVNMSEIGVFPEVSVARNRDELIVTLTKRPSERLVINRTSPSLQEKKGTFLRENRKRAAFLIKALQYRETNLAKVAQAIVAHQAAWFLNEGVQKPLGLREIADVCGIHESSVSRIVRGKYLICDRGVFELKHFFSAKIVREDNDDVQSATSVKDQIKAIIGKENKAEPLSDQKILEKLNEQGFTVSRRTVAKYREGLAIGAAHERRTLS